MKLKKTVENRRDEKHAMESYWRRRNDAATADDVARMMTMTNAQRHLLAHLSSTSRMLAIICWRSSSVFSGIHAGIESEVDGGSRKGESRMKAPKNQKGGNTTRTVSKKGL